MQQLRSRAVCATSEAILSFLTERQFVRPHRRLGDVMIDLHQATGACELAVNRAMEWLKLDAAAPVGRLRRTELTQLSRSIHRFWRAAVHHTDA
ncbi:MAG TPA: hypothetical protein PLD59_02660 [Tepidisphaeraceae bacterium]|nr:hypothetical protein [Tepidisphaeraceae bacterium]